MSTIIKADEGPALPLLMRVNDDDPYPIYTGPLAVARMLVQRDHYIHEVTKYEVKHGAFISTDPAGDNVMSYSVNYTSPEAALREALGVHFTREEHDSVSLSVALRRIILDQLDQLEGATA